MTKECNECEGFNQFKKNRNSIDSFMRSVIGKKPYLISISTPYLVETVKNIKEYYSSKGRNPKTGLSDQIIKYGFNSKNLSGKDHIITKKGNLVLLSTDEKSIIPCKVFADLEISGCTENSEREIRELKGSGLLVARYSIFYGGNSRYTGSTPQDAGYSLDIPKDPKIVKALLKNDSFLEAILERDGSKILNSLGKMNKKLDRPVLVTPYLEQTLEIEK